MPLKPIQFDSTVHIRMSSKQLSAIEDYAQTIEAPVSYALRRLVMRGLQAETEREAA